MYANDFKDNYPTGRENRNQWHALRVKDETWTNLVMYSGNIAVLDCPNFKFNPKVLGRYNDDWGFLIGYCYMVDAADAKDQAAFNSGQGGFNIPRKNTDSPTNVVIVDANTWGTDGSKCAPHTKSGSISQNGSSYTFSSYPGTTPQSVGAEGGNVGHSDGSVLWKGIKNMGRFRASWPYSLYYVNW
jgi:hypothetical protein